MRQSDCYQLGEVIKTHGLRGEVSIHLDVDTPAYYHKLESVFLEQQGKLTPFFIESIHINGSKALVYFEDISSIEEAKPLVKCKLFLPLSALPKLEKNQYYFHDLVGCKVYEAAAHLGVVKEVVDLNGNQLLTVIAGDKEILIPLKDELLTKVDVEAKEITVQLPDGLLDIYNE